jgi:hypothetical protein
MRQPPGAPADASGCRAGPARRIPCAVLAVIGIIALIAIIWLFSVLTHTDAVTGSVQAINWNRVIAIEAVRTVSHQDWKTEIPSSAKIGSCTKKYYNTQNQPAPVSTEVCGTSYVVDQGTGKGKVVRDCNYQVYADFCEYTAQEWQVVDRIVAQGSDMNPIWPNVSLAGDQRAGAKQELYTIQFSTSNGVLTYKTSDFDTFSKCQVGTSWTLNVNRANEVVSIGPGQ